MVTLYYVHDPMCSWCWGFTRTWQDLRASLPSHIAIVRLLGGLAADTDTPMPEATRQMVQDNWQRIESHIPGVKFNFDFWQRNQPRRATYPACRAVIAARQQGNEYDEAMTAAIQRAYYHEARNPSNDSTLIELANELGLDSDAFTHALHAASTQETLLKEIHQAHAMYVNSFPSLVLANNDSHWPIAIDYNHSQPMLELIKQYTAPGEDHAG